MTIFLLFLSLARAQGWPDVSKPAAPSGDGKGDAAVIVGVDKYAFVPPVPGAARNAEDWQAYLTGTRGVPAGRVKLLRDAEATLEEIRESLDWAAQNVKPGATLWFVFIGHGAPHKDGKDGVLIGVDAQQRASSLYARSLRQSELLEAFRKGAQGATVAVLDACFSGRGGDGKELIAGLQPLVLAAPAAPGASTALFLAGRSDQFAGPLPGAGRPAFSYLLLGALRGWGDADKDGQVTPAEAVAYAREALQATVKDRTQTPELSGGLTGPLAAGAKEAGPDLAALVRAARPAAASELSFNPVAPAAVPRIDVKSAAGGFKDVNLQAERLFEDAMALEQDGKSSPFERMEAWCLAASYTERNPYLPHAQAACRQWQDHADRQIEQELVLGEDYLALRGYVGLRLKSKEQKLAALGAFLEAYGGLKDDRVKSVDAARNNLATGNPVYLIDLGSQGVPLPAAVQPEGLPVGLWDEAFKGTVPYENGRRCKIDKDPNSCLAVANELYNEYNRDQFDPVKAALFYEISCRFGYGHSCASGARLLLKRSAPARAMSLLALGCASFLNDDACDGLAQASADNSSYGIPGEHRRRAALILEARCLRRAPKACVHAGEKYRAAAEAHSGVRDLARSRRLFALACASGQSQLSCDAAEAMRKQEQALADFVGEVVGDQPVTQTYSFRWGACLTNKNCQEHLKACRTARKDCLGIAGAFQYGSVGANIYKPLAFELYRLACAAGGGRACLMAEGMLNRRDEVSSTSPFLAFDLKKRGCESGVPESCASLRIAYLEGAGTAPSQEKALEAAQRGCKLGSAAACKMAETP